MSRRILTAIIPVYAPRFYFSILKRTLLMASQSSIDIILVLDRLSTEELAELNLFVDYNKMGNITLLLSSGPGAAAARNTGIDHIHSEWVCFWDADDNPNVAHFIDMAILGQNKNVDLVVGEIKTRAVDGTESSFLLRADSSHILKELAVFPAFTRIVFRSDSLRQTRFPEIRFGEDQVFLANIVARQPRIIAYHHTVYAYNIGTTFQATSTVFPMKELSIALKLIQNINTAGNKNVLYLQIVKVRVLISIAKLNLYQFQITAFANFLKAALGVFSNRYSLQALFWVLRLRKRIR